MKNRKIFSVVFIIVLIIGLLAITGCSSSDDDSGTGIEMQTVSWGYGNDGYVFSIDIPEDFGNFTENDKSANYYKYGEADELLGMVAFQYDSNTLVMTDELIDSFMDGVKGGADGIKVKEDTMSGKVATLSNGIVGFEVSCEMDIKGTKYYENQFTFNAGSGNYTVIILDVNKQDSVWGKMLSSLEITDDEASEEVEGSISEDETKNEDPTADWTMEQQNCYESATSYLESGSFSRRGLIDQLSSEYGDNYPRKVAIFVVNKLKKLGAVDWNEEAEESARGYLESGSFSKQELIDQLSSEYGDKFTRKQAKRAVEKVYK